MLGVEGKQKRVLRITFGEHLARSVPNLGKFNYATTVEEEADARILDTRQLSGASRNWPNLIYKLRGRWPKLSAGTGKPRPPVVGTRCPRRFPKSLAPPAITP